MPRARNVPGASENHQVYTTGKKDTFGLYHHYEINILYSGREPIQIEFQNSPVRVYGANGCSEQDLLAIVIDRLTCIQRGKLSSAETGGALTCAQTALECLNERPKDRKVKP